MIALFCFALIASPSPAQNVIVYTPAGMGSGVLLSNSLALTAAHVVGESEIVAVKCGDDLVTALVGKRDAHTDLAMLGLLGPCKTPTSQLAKTTPAPGEDVFALGCPARQCGRISRGVVSAIEPDNGTPMIITDIPTFFGASGGGLYNAANELVGIASVGGCFHVESLTYCYSAFVPAAVIHGFLQ